jgi:hypothetical protein
MIPEHKKGRAMQRKTKTAKEEQTVVAWKGFDKNFQCRGYQFEVGKTYEHTGRVEVCRSGFHACENPLDVWGYYSRGEDNRFAKVTLGGELSRCGDDTKIAGGRITIEAEVRLPDMIRAAVDWVIAATRGKGDNPSRDSARIGSSGNSAQIGSSGNSARIGSSGDSARIEASGKDAVVSCAGNNACVKAGEGGAICIPYHDGERVRFAVGYVGEDGIKPDTWYRAAAGRLVPA